MITVFYDGKCGLCLKEINHYRKIAPEGLFDWQDITNSAGKLEEEGIALSEGLRLLHANDENGKLHVGVDAFILIWKQLRRWRTTLPPKVKNIKQQFLRRDSPLFFPFAA